jgi:hypothetical protein
MCENVAYRTLQQRYQLSLGALSRHRRNCLATAVKDALPEEPAVHGLRRLHQRTLRILAECESAKDWPTALAGVREARRNLELIARLSAELDPRASESGNLSVQIVYAERVQAAVAPPGAIVDAVPVLPEPESTT